MPKSRVLVTAALLALVAGAPLSASAQDKILTLPISGQAWVGTYSGSAWVLIRPWSGGACRSLYLGNGQSRGLGADTLLRGTTDADIIVVMTSSWDSPCGHLDALEYDGHFFDVNGGGGNDYIDAGIGGIDYNGAYGAAGNDVLYMDRWGGHADGGSGIDYLYSYGHAMDTLYGGSGNDLFCVKRAATSTVSLIDGGADSDRRCGNATNVASVENIDCGACGNFSL